MTPHDQNIAQTAPHKHRRIPYVYAEDGTRLKVCTDCLVPKPFDNFPKGKSCRDGIYPSCKLCCKKYNETYYQNNKDAIRATINAWMERNKSTIAERNTTARNEYLLSVENGGPEKTKVCTRCKGDPQPLSKFGISLTHNDGYTSHCKKCIAEQTSFCYYRNKEAISLAGREQRRATWPKRAIKSCKQRASAKGIPFNITVVDLYDHRTGELPINCPIFPHIFLDYEAGPDRRLWASVDRIVPELGYVKGNICVMSYGANTWKSNGSNPEERRRIIQIMTGALIAV